MLKRLFDILFSLIGLSITEMGLDNISDHVEAIAFEINIGFRL